MGKKEFPRFGEHVLAPFELFLGSEGRNVAHLRALDVPFPFSKEDIHVAYGSIVEAQTALYKQLMLQAPASGKEARTASKNTPAAQRSPV